MKVGVLPVDSLHPNYALMKVSNYWKRQGAEVEFYTPFAHYDLVYASKIFTFTPDYPHPIVNADEVVRGGTGYDISSRLPTETEGGSPDYDLYFLDKRFALGFLTRGCPNACPWCVVPRKEGSARPYRDIEEIATDGRDHVTLMDNNVLASEYGLSQIEKIVKLGLYVDFNQNLDARLIDMEVARLLVRVKWRPYIRLSCDTAGSIPAVTRAWRCLRDAGYKGEILVCTLLTSDIIECLHRIETLRALDRRVSPFAQPYRDFGTNKEPPQWQKDMARWVNRKEIFRTTNFYDYAPRHGFRCSKYFNK